MGWMGNVSPDLLSGWLLYLCSRVQIAAVNVAKFNWHFTAVVLAVCRCCCWCKCWLGDVYVLAKKFVESAAGVVVGVSVGWVLCMCRPRSLWRAPPRWWRQTCPKMKLRSWKRNWLLLEAQQRLSDVWLLFHKGTECKPVCRRHGPPMHLPHFVDFRFFLFLFCCLSDINVSSMCQCTFSYQKIVCLWQTFFWRQKFETVCCLDRQ